MIDPGWLVPTGTFAVFAGAVVLGLIHGAEPGHGWPIAATYALDRPRKWLNGLAASVLLGVGHLVSSLAVVAAFFLAKSYFELARVNEPVSVLGLRIGGPVSIVAGILLIGLGVREYRRGHAHGHPHGDGHGPPHDHAHEDDHTRADGHDRAVFRHREHGSPGHDHGGGQGQQGHDHDHHGHHDAGRGHDHGGRLGRVAGALPFVGGAHAHEHPTGDDLDTKGLWGIVWTAFVLGFAHEEEFEIIGLCLGSDLCLALMVAYSLAVIVALVGLTMLLIAGYERYGDRVEGLAEHFPTVSAAVLVAMGLGFVVGIL